MNFPLFQFYLIFTLNGHDIIWAAAWQNIHNDVRPAFAQSYQSSLCAQRVAKEPSFVNADIEDSDQTGRMPSHYKWSKHLKFRISNMQIICIYNAFIHVQWCTELSYLFISGYDLYKQLFTTKPSIVCVHDNVRKRVFAIFQGKVWGGGGAGVLVARTTLPNLQM